MTPKRPRDPNQLAKSIIDIATGQQPNPVDNQNDANNPARVKTPRHLIAIEQVIRSLPR
jgi:hypothetical protein